MNKRTKRKAEKQDETVLVSVKMTHEERKRIREQGAKKQRSVSAEIRYRMGMAYVAEATE